MARFDLSDAEWRIIALRPDKPRGVPRADDRRVLNGVFHVLRTGSPWRDVQHLPVAHPHVNFYKIVPINGLDLMNCISNARSKVSLV